MVPRTNTLSVRPQGLSCFREPFCFISYLKLGNHLHLPKQKSRQVPTTQLNCVVRAKSSSNKMYPKRGSPTLRSARSSEQCLERCGDTQCQRPHRLVARMSRRGRDNPGSTPGVVIQMSPYVFTMGQHAHEVVTGNCRSRAVL